MTNQELNAALDLTRKINRLQCKLDDLRATGGIGSPSTSERVLGGMGVTPGQVAAELEQEIVALQGQRDIERVIIRRYIEKLGLDGVGRKLMSLRYADCWDWRSVEKAIGYSHSRTMHFHSDAIEKAGHGRTPQDLNTACQ